MLVCFGEPNEIGFSAAARLARDTLLPFPCNPRALSCCRSSKTKKHGPAMHCVGGGDFDVDGALFGPAKGPHERSMLTAAATKCQSHGMLRDARNR